MAFNTLECLEKGKVDFVFDLTIYDYRSLIQVVRQNPRKKEIVKGFFPLLKDKLPDFCFEIVLDMSEYENFAYNYFKNAYSIKSIKQDKLASIINNSVFGEKIIEDYLDTLFERFSNDLDFIFDYLFKDIPNNIELLERISTYKDLHIRCLFMIYLIKKHKDIVYLFYDDISRYLTSETFKENEQLSLFEPELMSMEDLSLLAFVIFEEKYDYKLFQKIKEVLFTNYKTNNLAKYLIENKKMYQITGSYQIVPNYAGIREVGKDPDTYFRTANQSKYGVYEYFSRKISEELRNQYEEFLKYFKKANLYIDDIFVRIDDTSLSRVLEQLVKKYLDLSKSDKHYFIEEGSTASVYRIGDFVFKLDRTKWSYEEIICPDLYLILPNLEEIFLRDEKRVVTAGIEVQRYLEKSAKKVPKEVQIYFREELANLGYYSTDSLVGGPCGDNCRLLNDYIESGNPNPPDWFKDYPMVLVDRDRVYKLENKTPKQLTQRY